MGSARADWAALAAAYVGSIDAGYSRCLCPHSLPTVANGTDKSDGRIARNEHAPLRDRVAVFTPRTKDRHTREECMLTVNQCSDGPLQRAMCVVRDGTAAVREAARARLQRARRLARRSTRWRRRRGMMRVY